jgi:hypothetical protein
LLILGLSSGISGAENNHSNDTSTPAKGDVGLSSDMDVDSAVVQPPSPF